MNAAYDPDPLLGSGSLTGFNEWAAFYTHYRVLSFCYDVQISNQESFPLVALVAPTHTDVGANYTSTDQFSEFPYGKKNILSAKTGKDNCRFRGDVNIAKFEGSREPLTDMSFASAVATVPAQLRFFNIGCDSGSVYVNGVFVSVLLIYEVQFFARLPIPG
jgi:hypothetical protein